MTYMQELEARLKNFFAEFFGSNWLPEEDLALIITEVKAIALQSYRNGQKAGAPKRAPRQSAKSAPAQQ